MQVRLLEPRDYAVWDKFVEQAADGSIFHTAAWHRYWGESPAIYVAENKNFEIVGGLPLLLRKRFGQRYIARPPFTQLNGPVLNVSSTYSNCRFDDSARNTLKLLVKEVPNIAMVDFKLSSLQLELFPFIWDGYEFQPLYTYLIPVDSSETWKNDLHSTHARNLKKARQQLEEDGLIIQNNRNLQDFYHLFEATAKRQLFRLPSREKLATWWSNIQDAESGKIYTCEDRRGECHCATMMIWDPHQAYYLLGGLAAGSRSGGRYNFLLFERMITDAHSRGLDFDFEGSLLPGVERFFRNWGGDLRLMIRALKFRHPVFREIFRNRKAFSS